jgi:hypothetical protein
MTTAESTQIRASTRLQDLATLIRSKNAGPFQLTIDVLFGDEMSYRAVKAANAVTRERVSSAYRVPLEMVKGVYYWDSALALKVTMVREHAAGTPGDSDCYGAQQHVPILSIEVPLQALEGQASGT